MIELGEVTATVADNWVHASAGTATATAVLVYRRRARRRERVALVAETRDCAADDPASVASVFASDDRKRAALVALPNDVLMLLVGCLAQLPQFVLGPRLAIRNLRAVVEAFAETQARRAGACLPERSPERPALAGPVSAAPRTFPPVPQEAAGVTELRRRPSVSRSDENARYHRQRVGSERRYVTPDHPDL